MALFTSAKKKKKWVEKGLYFDKIMIFLLSNNEF